MRSPTVSSKPDKSIVMAAKRGRPSGSKILAGLRDAVAHAHGDATAARVSTKPNDQRLAGMPAGHPTSKRGRPTAYTPKIAAEICKRLSEGETLEEVCRSDHIPASSTVRLWIVEDREGFSALHARAREAQALRWAEEVVEISDDGSNDWMERNVGDGETITVADHEHISRSKLRVDTRKWLLAKVLPKIYGDKVAVTGEGGGPLVVEIVRFGDAKD